MVRDEIWHCMSQLKASGMTALVIDKHVRRLLDIAQRHYIVEDGKIAWVGTSSELAAQPELWQRYLGVTPRG
jgi:branched-chain amino acid transport system ATP-binding protein